MEQFLLMFSLAKKKNNKASFRTFERCSRSKKSTREKAKSFLLIITRAIPQECTDFKSIWNLRLSDEFNCMIEIWFEKSDLHGPFPGDFPITFNDTCRNKILSPEKNRPNIWFKVQKVLFLLQISNRVRDFQWRSVKNWIICSWITLLWETLTCKILRQIYSF